MAAESRPAGRRSDTFASGIPSACTVVIGAGEADVTTHRSRSIAHQVYVGGGQCFIAALSVLCAVCESTSLSL